MKDKYRSWSNYRLRKRINELEEELRKVKERTRSDSKGSV